MKARVGIRSGRGSGRGSGVRIVEEDYCQILQTL